MGNFGRNTGMSKRTQDATADLWSIIGYLANSLLFLLVGLQIGAQNFSQALPAIGWVVLGILVGRGVMVYGLTPLHNWLRKRHPDMTLPSFWKTVFLFSGLRGALSLVLVLSLPESIVQKDLLVGIVYGVVLFTLLGQGLGLRVYLPWWAKRHA